MCVFSGYIGTRMPSCPNEKGREEREREREREHVYVCMCVCVCVCISTFAWECARFNALVCLWCVCD
jgi:hypothetical protein